MGASGFHRLGLRGFIGAGGFKTLGFRGRVRHVRGFRSEDWRCWDEGFRSFGIPGFVSTVFC